MKYLGGLGVRTSDKEHSVNFLGLIRIRIQTQDQFFSTFPSLRDGRFRH